MELFKMKFLWVLIFINVNTKITLASFCYWNTACSYKYFSSKTPYNAVRGDIRDSMIRIKECEPVSIWGMLRHGKTYPAIKAATQMMEAIPIRDLVVSSYEKGRCSLCAQDIDNLRDWPVSDEFIMKPNTLQDEGYKELFGIGNRLKQVYPEFLKKLEKDDYKFRPTADNWVEESAKAFVSGLGNTDALIEAPVKGFDFLDPYNGSNIDELVSVAEANQYTVSSEYLAAKDRLQRRLGIDYSLTDDNITSLYDLCRYTWSGLNNKASPWCALFTTEDLKVLEYIGDLVHYYGNAYGNSDATKFAQTPLEDLFENFQKAKDGKGRKITAYFTKPQILEMTFTALGWFKDKQPLTTTQKDKSRIWRTSKISVFAANLFIVLNRCTNTDSSDYHVMFYFNEEPMRSVCGGGICSWSEFETMLSAFLNTQQ